MTDVMRMVGVAIAALVGGILCLYSLIPIMTGRPLLGGILFVVSALFTLAVISRIMRRPAPAGAAPVPINWDAFKFAFLFFVLGWMAIDLLSPYRWIRWAIHGFCAGLAFYWFEVYGFNRWRQAVRTMANRIRRGWHPIARYIYMHLWRFILPWRSIRRIAHQRIVPLLCGITWIVGLFMVSQHGVPDVWKASQWLIFIYWVAPGVPAAITYVWSSTRQWTIVVATALGLFTLWWLAASQLGLASIGLVASVTFVWLSRYFPAP